MPIPRESRAPCSRRNGGAEHGAPCFIVSPDVAWLAPTRFRRHPSHRDITLPSAMTTPDPWSALEVATELYVNCETYEDSGVSTMTYSRGSRRIDRRTEVAEFSTAFVRPGFFRFEYAQRTVGPDSEWPRLIVWSRDGVVRSCKRRSGEPRVHENVGEALARYAGVTDTVSFFVPPLLLGANMCGIWNFEKDRSVSFPEHEGPVFEGEHPRSGSTIRVVMGKESRLIERIQHHSKLRSGVAVSQIVAYQAKIGEALNEDRFVFSPDDWV